MTRIDSDHATSAKRVGAVGERLDQPVGAAVRATDPEHLVALIVRAYNAGDTAAVDELFEPDAVLVIQPGEPATGARRRQANTEFIQLGFLFTITVRHVFHCGEIALLIADHVVEGTGPDGEQVRMAGTATDVIRRGTDGFWRYVIDNPWGVDR